MNQRGEYGRSRVGVSTNLVPVIDVGGISTSRFAIWDPEAQQVAGRPYYFSEQDGGWWLFYNADGEVTIGERRFRPYKAKAPVTVFEPGTRAV